MTREEAIKHLKDIRRDMWTEDSEVDAINMAIESLEQPERKKGRWLPLVEADENGEPYQAGVYCSECGNGEVYEPNFCSCCGADLRGEKNEQTN